VEIRRPPFFKYAYPGKDRIDWAAGATPAESCVWDTADINGSYKSDRLLALPGARKRIDGDDSGTFGSAARMHGAGGADRMPGVAVPALLFHERGRRPEDRERTGEVKHPHPFKCHKERASGEWIVVRRHGRNTGLCVIADKGSHV
jgi:hypothetical protein